MKHIHPKALFFVLATFGTLAAGPYAVSQGLSSEPSVSERTSATDIKSGTSPALLMPFGMETFETKLPRFQTPPKALPVLEASFKAGEAPLWMYGNVTSTSEPLDEPLIGIYRYQLNSSSHNRERVHIDMGLRGLYGNAGWTPEGFHIAKTDHDAQTYTHYLYDTENWSLIREVSGLTRLHEFNSSAWDWRENRQAALCISDSAWAIHDFAHFKDMTGFDRTKGFPVMIKNALIRAIAVDTDGTAFGIDYNGVLYEINRFYKYLRVIGNTGLPTPYDTSMYIDPLTHKLYYVQNDQKTALYILNTETAQATHVWDFPWKEQIFGLYTHQPLALDGAPAAAAAMTLDFDGASKAGKVTFTVPSTTYGGAPLTGDVDYEVYVDRRKVGTGKAAPSAHASVAVEPDTVGYHKFNVVFSNSEGSSPYTVEDRWIGLDYVESVKSPVCEYLGSNKVKVSWGACLQSQHGGYMPAGEVVYDVVRYPGAVAVARGLQATSFEETLDIPEEGPVAFYYTVSSRVRDLEGKPTESNKVVVGSSLPPCDFPMADEAQSLVFTAIDADGDGYGWQWAKGRWISYYNPYTYKDRDDWLITSPITVEKGKSYLLSFRICGHQATSPQRFEVWGGSLPAKEALTDKIMPSTTIENDNWSVEEFTAWVTPRESGEYYIALRATAPAEDYYLYLHSMHIGEAQSAAAPKAPEGFKVYTADEGGTYAYHTLTLPAQKVSGEKLESLQYVSVKRNGEEVWRKENPVPGEKIEFTERLKRTGDYQYTAVAANEAGEGLEASLTAHIGNTTPAQVVDAAAGHAGNGEVWVSWTAPEYNMSGCFLNPNFLTFSVAYRDGTKIAENIKGERTVLPHIGGNQRFEQLYIRAHYPGGQSDPANYTNPVLTGDALSVPYAESFAGAEPAHAWMSQTLASSGRWGTADDSGSITSADGDGGFMVYNAQYEGAQARLTGSYVTMDAQDPLSFKCSYFCQEGNENTLEVQIHDGDEWHTIGVIYCGQGTPYVWNAAEFPIPQQYAGQIVQIGILGNTVNSQQSFIDCIAIDTPSGIETAGDDVAGPSFEATAEGNVLRVTAHGGNAVHVYTASGSMIATVRGERRIVLPGGIYILRCKGTAQKIIL